MAMNDVSSSRVVVQVQKSQRLYRRFQGRPFWRQFTSCRCPTTLYTGSRYNGHQSGNSHISCCRTSDWKNVNNFPRFVHDPFSSVKFRRLRCLLLPEVQIWQLRNWMVISDCSIGSGELKFQALYPCFQGKSRQAKKAKYPSSYSKLSQPTALGSGAYDLRSRRSWAGSEHTLQPMARSTRSRGR